jgi:hypothetical protein
MPLPLPNLDTRRWADLVEEGRALIPRYAPQWSDHNIHDPGITLIELFAWLIEADIYRTNRVPRSYRRKFLQLIGYAPMPPQPARVVLKFAMKSGHQPVPLPAGLTLVTNQSGTQIPFRLLNDLLVVDTEIAAVQAFDGKDYVDHTRAQKGHFDFLPWGDHPRIPESTDPETQPALYLGLSTSLPSGKPTKLWFRFFGPQSGSTERQRLLDATQTAQADCQPIYPTHECSLTAVGAGYDLRLLSVDAVDGLVTEGHNLIVIGLLGNKLHIRIFDAIGKRVFDKEEGDLIGGEALAAIKNLLNPFPDESSLSQKQKQEIINDAILTAGYNPTDPWCPPAPSLKRLSRPSAVASAELPLHHSIRTAWDYWDGGSWQTLDELENQVVDDTRGFTLNGAVSFKLPTLMSKERFGVVKDKFHYLRARLIAGQPDYLPVVSNVEINAEAVEQATSSLGIFVIRPGIAPTLGQQPEVGKLGHLSIELDKDDMVTKLAFAPAGNGPEVRVVAYVPAEPLKPGTLTITLVMVGRGTGLPGLKVVLPNAPVVASSMKVWTILDGKLEEWHMRPDLNASGRTDAHFALEATTGAISFGDGEKGRVVPFDAAILVSFDMTSAANGNVLANVSWSLANANNDFNLALLGTNPATIADVFNSIENPAPAIEGADEEDLEHAAGRAAEVLWAHERLLELCAASGSQVTLDGLDRNSVLERAAPTRATTLIDYERLALNVPGAPVARARAWAGLDPHFPCLKAPGTVVVIVVPWLPAKRPMASPALIAVVLRHLERRRVVGTRLVVVGPQYVEVAVRAKLVVKAGIRFERVIDEVRAALDNFLNPLSGGPDKHGWPFGRDVYRSEVLEVIDKVVGIDHVEDLELIADGNPAQCGNLCVGSLKLVTPGTHLLNIAENLISKGGSHVYTKT